eukprot:1335524-Ditylum_brightwellii.AAC.1
MSKDVYKSFLCVSSKKVEFSLNGHLLADMTECSQTIQMIDKVEGLVVFVARRAMDGRAVSGS